jgi:hypothetical protein
VAKQRTDYPGKREALEKHSLLVLNREITQSQSWNEAAILARSKALLPLALNIWRLPETQQQQLAKVEFNVNAMTIETPGELRDGRHVRR